MKSGVVNMNRIRRVKRLNRDIFVTKTYKWMATGLLLLITIPIVLAVPAIEIKFKNMRTIDDLYPDYKIADVINDDLIVTIPTEYEEKSVNNKKIRVNKNLKEEKIKYSDINIGKKHSIIVINNNNYLITNNFTVINAVLNKKYTGDSKEIEKGIERFIDKSSVFRYEKAIEITAKISLFYILLVTTVILITQTLEDILTAIEARKNNFIGNERWN